LLDPNNVLLQTEGMYQSLNSLMNIKEIDKASKSVTISFYFGAPGFYLTACHYNFCKQDFIGFQTSVKNLLLYYEYIMINDKKRIFYYEVLYGVAGFLHCLLDLQKHYQNDGTDKKYQIKLNDEILSICKLIVTEGMKKYGDKIDIDKLPPDFRLHYTFHDREYIGAAHGTFGVLYMLLVAYQQNKEYFLTKDKDFTNLLLGTVKASLKTLVNLQQPDGNFSSSYGKAGGRLVQFCHGSPGGVTCLLVGAEVFKGTAEGKLFMESGLKAGENIWKFGIIKKGFGLCHGISGNGYAMLALYRHTSDMKWLYRSSQFALLKENRDYMDTIENYEFDDRYVIGKSDYPFSLMMGLAGDLGYECDLIFPAYAKFPGYEV